MTRLVQYVGVVVVVVVVVGGCGDLIIVEERVLSSITDGDRDRCPGPGSMRVNQRPRWHN